MTATPKSVSIYLYISECNYQSINLSIYTFESVTINLSIYTFESVTNFCPEMERNLRSAP